MSSSTSRDRFTLQDRKDGRSRALGLGVTIFVHVAVIGTVFVMNEIEKSHAAARPEDKFVPIEAGLAIKTHVNAAKPAALPPKEKPPEVKPPEPEKVATNPDVVPPPKPPEKPKPTPPPDPPQPKIDDVMKKHRKPDPDDDEPNKEGQDTGDKFGTLLTAKGDPYIGELIGRMTTNFTVPSVVRATGLETWGCVIVDDTGHIIKRSVDPLHKSGVAAFDNAVDERLRVTTDMEHPVPERLKSKLIGNYVCAKYRID